MSYRIVTDVLPSYPNASGSFFLRNGSFTESDTYPPERVDFTTDSNGAYGVELWANGEGLVPSEWLAVYPGKESIRFVLPAGVTPITMAELRLAEQVDWSTIIIPAAVDIERARYANNVNPTLGSNLVGHVNPDGSGTTVRATLIDAAAAIPSDTDPALPAVVAMINQGTYHRSSFTTLAGLFAAVNTHGGGKVDLGEGTIDISASLPGGSNTEIVGRGRLTTIRVPAGSSFNPIDLDGKTNSRIASLSFAKAAGADLTGTASAVNIRGDSADIEVENVHATGFVRAVNIAGEDGSTPGTARRIHVKRSRGDWSRQFAACISNAEDVTLEDYYSDYNWLDGIKVRAKTKFVKIIRGASRYNGQSYYGGGGDAGDGIDAYAGGDTITIRDHTAEYNYGNGHTVKTDSGTASDPATFGYVRKVLLTGNHTNFQYLGSGTTFYTFPTGDYTIPAAAFAIIDGNEAIGNNLYGIWGDARNMTIVNNIVLLNQRHGILLDLRAQWFIIGGNQVAANSQASAGTYHGIYVLGIRGIVGPNVSLGVEADIIRFESDYLAATKMQGRNVYIAGTADEIEVQDQLQGYATNTAGIRSDVTTATTTLTANALTGADTLSVADLTHILPNRRIRIRLTNGSDHDTRIKTEATGSSFQILDALPSAAASGNAVTFRKTAIINSTITGTPATVGAPGTRGSRATNINGTAGSIAWVKTSDDINPTVDWAPIA